MQWIRDIYEGKKGPVISFELFPPKTPEGEANLLGRTLPELLALKPDYCSVTYGAGGGTRDRTLRVVEQLACRHGVVTLAHLTCVNSTRTDIGNVVAQLRGMGVTNILALRGDPPAGSNGFEKIPGGFEYAWELVRYLKEEGGFSIGVAGFPEGHPACKEGKLADWEHLVAKIGYGADFVLTQLFFDNADFFQFRDYLRGRGVKIPIVPGIIPILSAAQIEKFTSLCGARLPDKLRAELARFADNDDACAAFGIEYATRQCRELLDAGVPGLHFYTLNKARSTREVLRRLGLA